MPLQSSVIFNKSLLFRRSMLAVSITLSLPVYAADCAWDGGTGNWSDANWSGTDCVSPPTAADTATIGSGSVILDSDQTVQGVTLTGGDLTGTGTLTASGQTTLSGGSMSGEGATRAEGGLLLDGGFKDIQDNRTLVNASGQNASWTAGELQLHNSGSTLVNEGGASFDISGATRALYGSGTFDNSGTLTSNLDDILQIVTIRAEFNNSGTVDVVGGELRLGDGGAHTGSFTGGADGVLNISGGNHVFAADSSITADQVRFSNQTSGGGNFVIEGAYAAGNTTVAGNTVNFNVDASTGSLTQTGGDLNGAGTLTVSGATTMSGGSMSGEGATRAEGGLLLDGGFKDIRDNRTLVNASGQSASWTAGELRLLNPGSTLVNEGGATFNISGDTRSLYGSGAFNNAGSVVVNTTDSSQVISVSTLNNSGSIDIQQGTLHSTDNDYENDGNIRIADNATLGGVGNLVNNPTGSVTGAGLIDPGASFAFTNAGQISPGDGIGTLSVDGDLTLLTSSIFNVDLGGLNEFDLLSVSGDSSLDGTVNVSLVNGFMPTVGQTFDILLTEALTGEFTSIVSSNSGIHWSMRYIIDEAGQDIARLGVSAVPIPAAGWLFLSGIAMLAGVRRRRGAS